MSVQRGMECGGREHKTAFFAEILLMVSMPITTLPNIHSILQSFSRLSGLFVNQDKSRALNISQPDRTIKTLQTSYKFVWEPVALSYLGINLTCTIHILYSQNYPALHKRLATDLISWQVNPPSWFGMLYSIKMNILPRTLYLFRALPVALVRTD